jgi:hypothetical protein
MDTPYEISTDKTRLDVPLIHRFLSQESYWAVNIPIDIVQRSIENSLCFGVYVSERQVGFARVIPIRLPSLIWPMCLSCPSIGAGVFPSS